MLFIVDKYKGVYDKIYALVFIFLNIVMILYANEKRVVLQSQNLKSYSQNGGNYGKTSSYRRTVRCWGIYFKKFKMIIPYKKGVPENSVFEISGYTLLKYTSLIRDAAHRLD